MGLLPTKKSVKKTDDPKNLIIFGLPKCGKSSSLAQLENNLIVDLEDGSNYISGYIAKATTWQELRDIAKELATTEHQFKFVTIDTLTALEDVALDLACRLYQQTQMGRNFEYKNPTDILKLPNGAGYLYTREAMQTIIGWFEKTGLNLILVCHVKDKMITDSASEEMTVKAIDLSGKIGNILSAKSDAIGYAYRNTEENKVYLNFGANTSIICSARPAHLNGKTILLSEMDNKGNLITHWENIYPSLKKNA